MSDLVNIRQSLPEMVEAAGRRLMQAKTSAHVLEVKALAEMALHYAKVTRAANETHADCLRIITRAEMRMANEVDRGQGAGEIAKPGAPLNVRSSDILEMPDLGISRQRLSEWRDVRDVGDEIVERTLSSALSEGRAPTKSEIYAAAKAFKKEDQDKKRDRRDEKEVALSAAISAASEQIGCQLYGVIYADPPWRFEPYSRDTGMDRAADNHYPTSGTQAILAMCPPSSDDAVLFLWSTSPMLPDALDVLSAWGFAYKSHIIWNKDRIGTGYWARNKHELLLIGTKGSIPAPSPGTQPASVVDAPLGLHSEKPAVFAELIEQLYPSLPKLEMFCRSPRPGWDVWGAEAETKNG